MAKNNLGVSEENLKNTLMTTVYNVESAYWNLVYSIENLDVRRQSLQLAKDLLEKNQRSVEVGTLAPMEVLSARAEVATREADLIQAETQIQSNEDQLKLLLNITEDEDKAYHGPRAQGQADLRRKDGRRWRKPWPRPSPNRPDLEISRIGLETDKLNLSYAKNQILPDLNLSASLYAPGIDGTRIFYIGSPLDGDHRLHHPRRHRRRLEADHQVQVSELEPGPDHEPAPVQHLLPRRAWPSPGST